MDKDRDAKFDLIFNMLTKSFAYPPKDPKGVANAYAGSRSISEAPVEAVRIACEEIAIKVGPYSPDLKTLSEYTYRAWKSLPSTDEELWQQLVDWEKKGWYPRDIIVTYASDHMRAGNVRIKDDGAKERFFSFLSFLRNNDGKP